MKQLFFLILFCIVLVGNLVAQTISNIDFFAEDKKVVVTYELSGCELGEMYDVYLDFVDQYTMKVITPISVSGDVIKVTCGTKRIFWDISKDLNVLSGKFYPEIAVKKVTKGTIYKRNSVEIEFVNIPAGTFTMGSPSNEVNRGSDEQQYQVTLSAFKLSKYEITFAQFDAFCDATGRNKPSDNGWGRGSRPVINVSWNDAKAFADWMGCRLPTEAEWEYACRAGTTTPFNTGNNLNTSQANYDGNYPYNGGSIGVILGKTQIIGSYLPNAWELNDMHGNVWEWCNDWYGNYGTGIQTNPTGPNTGTNRVRRGGSWLEGGRLCRSSFRGENSPSYGRDNLGFRLVVP